MKTFRVGRKSKYYARIFSAKDQIRSKLPQMTIVRRQIPVCIMFNSLYTTLTEGFVARMNDFSIIFISDVSLLLVYIFVSKNNL